MKKKITPEKKNLILSGKAFTAHEALELGLVDKIATFEEFRYEKFKDTPVVLERIRTAKTPRFFRFPNSSSDDAPLSDLFTSLISMDVEQIVNLDIKDFLLQAFEKMTPEQVRSIISDIAGISAELNLKRIMASVNP